jgi:hypothetical protein
MHVWVSIVAIACPEILLQVHPTSGLKIEAPKTTPDCRAYLPAGDYRTLEQRQSKMAPCIFCKIIKGMLYLLLSFMETELLIGDIPSFKLFESEKVLAFLDIQPLSRGHAVCSIASPV